MHVTFSTRGRFSCFDVFTGIIILFNYVFVIMALQVSLFLLEHYKHLDLRTCRPGEKNSSVLDPGLDSVQVRKLRPTRADGYLAFDGRWLHDVHIYVLPVVA